MIGIGLWVLAYCTHNKEPNGKLLLVIVQAFMLASGSRSSSRFTIWVGFSMFRMNNRRKILGNIQCSIAKGSDTQSD